MVLVFFFGSVSIIYFFIYLFFFPFPYLSLPYKTEKTQKKKINKKERNIIKKTLSRDPFSTVIGLLFSESYEHR